MKNEDNDDPERAQVRRSDHQRRNEQQSLLIKQELERMRRSRRITTPVERVSRSSTGPGVGEE